MSLPFTTEEFFAVFAAYNRTLWPFAVALWVLAAPGAVALARSRDASRVHGIVLPVQWAWAGGTNSLPHRPTGFRAPRR